MQKRNFKSTGFVLLTIYMFVGCNAVTQTYHKDDKEGLRIFLRQPSAQVGKINAEQVGLEIADTINWQTNEAWVEKIVTLKWNNEKPTRLIEVFIPVHTIALSGSIQMGGGEEKLYRDYSLCLAGTLDARKWSRLTHLDCHNNRLIALDPKLTYLSCAYNPLTKLDVSSNTALTALYCGSNQLTTLDVATKV